LLKIAITQMLLAGLSEHQMLVHPTDGLARAGRSRQANWLLALESYDELEELFAAYAGDGNAPGFIYTRALAAFARRGASTQARALLGEARELNSHIPAYLTGPQEATEKASRLHGVQPR
jgi:hypothetical protein